MRISEQNIIKAGELAVVVGGGASGLGAVRLLRLLGARVRVLDKKGFSEAFKAEAARLDLELVVGEHKAEQFTDAALVTPSPGVPLKLLEPILDEACKSNPALAFMSELELASRFADEPIIAVTGTSGKTTTVSLVADMLRASGRKVFLGGNIGTPLSEYIVQREGGGEKADILVLEVSSFQLQGCRSFHPQVAMLLNLSENHLDQHKSMEEYVDAKFSIFACQTPDDFAILGPELLVEAEKRGLRAPASTFNDSGRFADTRLLGRHNRLNLEAAYLAASRFGVSLAEARKAAAEFEPLPHRLECVAEKNGLLYVNDSKCTTVEALRVALQSFERPVLLLAGGVFKGGDLPGLLPLLRERVKAVGLYGQSREIFEAAWKGALPLSWDEKLSGALKRLEGLAAPGDVILLAPATSSYDQYANYKERGEDFRRLAGAK